MNRLEGPHHFLEGRLVLVTVVRRREFELHPQATEMFFKDRADDVTQRHRGRSDLSADHLEPTRDLRGAISYTRVRDTLDEISVLGDRRDHSHQVRLTGA